MAPRQAPQLDARLTRERAPSRALVRWGLGMGVFALAVIVLAVVSLHGGSDGNAATAIPKAAATQTTPPFHWETVAGVLLPVSVEHGPRDETSGRAGSYSRTERGAALAAAQVLMRTSATSGSAVFLPVIATQVTGANTAAFKASILQTYQQLRLKSAVPDGDPIPSADARVAGYVVRDYRDGAATVEVVVDSPSLRSDAELISFAVSLQWCYGDWRVLAPPRGDWGSVATQLGVPPAGMLTYDRIG
jgi:hypothetical protein